MNQTAEKQTGAPKTTPKTADGVTVRLVKGAIMAGPGGPHRGPCDVTVAKTKADQLVKSGQAQRVG